jgi:hypothetical protein
MHLRKGSAVSKRVIEMSALGFTLIVTASPNPALARTQTNEPTDFCTRLARLTASVENGNLEVLCQGVAISTLIEQQGVGTHLPIHDESGIASARKRPLVAGPWDNSNFSSNWQNGFSNK